MSGETETGMSLANARRKRQTVQTARRLAEFSRKCCNCLLSLAVH